MLEFNLAGPEQNILTSERDALRWLKQVDKAVYRNRQDIDGDNAGVAAMRPPPRRERPERSSPRSANRLKKRPAPQKRSGIHSGPE
jgi:hypothetical protein